MQNARRLGRGVESRILAAAARDAIVSSREIARAVGSVGGLLAAHLQRIFRRLQADLKALPNKGARQNALGSVPGGWLIPNHPPKNALWEHGCDEAEASNARDASAVAQGNRHARPRDRGPVSRRLRSRRRLKNPSPKAHTRATTSETEAPRQTSQSADDASHSVVQPTSPATS
jgi:hypothetical protein